MKHTKPLALFMAAVMLMGTLIVPANACTADGYGNVTPCEKVEEQGYCDIEWLRGIDWEAEIMYQWPNPYYDREKVSQAAQTQTPAHTGLVSGSIMGAPTYFTKEEVIRGAMTSNEFGLGDIAIDWDSYTVTRTYNGVDYIYVFDPETFIYTVTNTSTGEVSIWAQYDKPQYWYVDNVLVDTATGEPVKTDPITGQPIETADTDKQYFDDVAPDAWYYDAVNTMAANGILNGYSDGLFHPDDYVTTGELCAIIYRIATNDNPVGKPVPGYPEYTHWAAYAIETLRNASHSYTSAHAVLSADETASRGEAIRAIMALLEEANLIDYKGISHSDKYTQVFYYTVDDNEIPDWDIITDHTRMIAESKGHSWDPNRILIAYNYGIVHGKDSTGRFDPAGGLTRAELCQMLANAGLTQYTPVELKQLHGYVSGG